MLLQNEARCVMAGTMIGKTVEIIDGNDTECLVYLDEMRALIGKTAVVIKENDDISLDIGDENWGWDKTWLKIL